MKAGIYYIAGTTQHHPTGQGTMLLEVYTWSGFVKQVATRAINGETYLRTYDSNASSWDRWYRYTLTAI